MNARLPETSPAVTHAADIAIAELCERLRSTTILLSMAMAGLEIVRPYCSNDGELDAFFKAWDASFIKKEIH